jgi:hypothetical protein
VEGRYYFLADILKVVAMNVAGNAHAGYRVPGLQDKGEPSEIIGNV